MALTKEDISIQGTGGYGTLSYTPEPGQNIEGTAGDIAAETATSGIVSSDASAELAGQAPNIVVPVNQSSDSVDRNINFETGDITGSTTGDINIYDEAALTGGATNTGGLTTLTDKIPDVLKPSTLGFALNLAKPGLGVLYNFIQAKRQEQQVQDLIDQQIESLETTGSTYNQRTGETVSNVTPESSQGSIDPGTNIDYETGEITGSPTGDVNIYDEVALTGGSTDDLTPTFTAPTLAPAPGPVYYDYSSGGDSGQSDSQAGADAAQEDDSAGYGGYAVGGIVRLRKNKQNSRIHDRRKRLAIGGIASLHG